MIKDDAKVSIIMSTYNERIEWLDLSIESILKQTYKNIEFVIVIDNPDNDELIKFLNKKSKEDNRIILIYNEKNKGLVYSLNRALTFCTGDYIARMDADDISYINRIEKQVNYMRKNKDVDLIGSKVEYIDELNRIIPGKINLIERDEKKISDGLKYENMLNHPTIFMKSEVICGDKIKGYRNVPYAEDYDLYTRLITEGFIIRNIDEIYLKYRVRDNGVSISNSFVQMKMAKYVKKMYRERLKYNIDSYNISYINKLIEDNRGKRLYELSEKVKVIKEENHNIIVNLICKIVYNLLLPYKVKEKVLKYFNI